MFDGNHRSRRQVNLGGGGAGGGGGAKNRRRGRQVTRATAAAMAHHQQHRNSFNSLPAFTAAVETGRESLLEQTRIAREERRRHQLEEKCVTKLQKVYRGWRARCYVAGDEVLGALWQQRHLQQNKSAAEALHYESFLLSLRLSPPLMRALHKSPDDLMLLIDAWLMEHASTIAQYKTLRPVTTATTAPYATAFRVVQMTLSRLRPLQRGCSLTETQCLGLFTILDHYLKNASLLWKRIGGANGLLRLLQSTQECLWWNHQTKIGAFTQNQMKKLFEEGEYAQKPSFALWNWTCKAVNELEQGSPLQRSAQALLAATVMGHHTGILNDASSSWWCHYGSEDPRNKPNLYNAYFYSLVLHVTEHAKQATGDEMRKTIQEFSAVLSQVLHGRWHVVLANALDWQHQQQQQSATSGNATITGLPSTALLTFLHHVLTNHNDLAILTSCVVQGDDVRSMVFSQQQHLQQDTVGAEDEEDDKLLEEEMEEQAASLPLDPMGLSTIQSNNDDDNNTTQQQYQDANETQYKTLKAAASTRKLLKQDIQTMPYLERLYQDERQKLKNRTVATLAEQARSTNIATKSYVQSLLDMAIQIGNPSLWISWGELLLPQLMDATNTPCIDNNGIRACEVYIQLLARVLQSTTGLRARTSASSPFLSQLAFAGGGTMVEWMWQAIFAHGELDSEKVSSQDILTCTTMTVFCDVFAHALIALSDEKFLCQYTNMNGSVGPKKRVVMAEQVIAYLRDLLHEVYWSKPVLLEDVKLAATSTTITSEEDSLRSMRTRLLLSGTKLWGSLYERWCRLVRTTPFCDESTWWFPHLASQEGGNAVVNSAVQRSASDPHGAMDMDIDDSASEGDEEDDAHMDQSQHDEQSAPTQEMSAVDAESDALANSFRDPKMARVLTCIPQALPFDRRVRLFDSLLTADKLKTQDENAEFRMAMLSMMRGEEVEIGGGRERVEIRRDRLYDDSMRQLNQLGSKLKKKVQVSFVNQHGTQEAGIDGGGVLKEFLEDLIKDAFAINPASDASRSSTKPRLFSVTPLQTLTVNSALTQEVDLLPHYEFLGRVLGKTVYESILVEPQFCLPFLNQLLGKRNSLEDLKNFDMEYYKNLTKLLTLNEADIDELCLTFELTLEDGASVRTVELLPGGRTKPVTKQNVIQYVHLVSHHRLNVEGAVQTKAFLRGFRDLIPASWVWLFSAYELQKLISGDDSLRGFDVASLKRSMKYAAGYHPSQPIMQWFWEVLEEFTPEQQRKFLRFVTSCSRMPLLGFNSLDPPPCVQQIRIPEHIFENDDAVVAKKVPLPTSSTCMNLLKLPNYRSKEMLRKKLLDAIESGAGFELT